MKLTVNGVTKNVRLYGIMTEHRGHKTAYIGNSMRGVTQPVSYSLSYNPRYRYCQEGGKIPSNTRVLASAISSTGSYWAKSSYYMAMDNDEIAEVIEGMADPSKLETLINEPDSYISVSVCG